MKYFYKIMMVLFAIVALVSLFFNKVDYAIFDMLWAILLELMYIEEKSFK